MKIFNKIALLAGFVGVALTSCESEYPEYHVGKKAVQDSAVVYFASNISNVVLQIKDSTVLIDVARFATEAATYNLDVAVEENINGAIEVPTTVTFDEGDLDTTIAVTVKDIELMRSYTVKIAIDEAWVNPYAMGENTVISFKVMREDYAPYAVGTYTDAFIYGASWETELQYSPSLNTYRFKDCWGFGTDVLFTWDGAESIVVTPAVVATGYVHPTYGMVSANYQKCYAVTAGDMVQMMFEIKWTVSAGSFGVYPNMFVFEKPSAEVTE